MSTYAQQAALAGDTAFRLRIRTAMMKGAGNILAFGFTPATPVTWQMRATLATQVILGLQGLTPGTPLPFLDQFSWSVVQDTATASAIWSSQVAITSTAAGPPLTVTTAAVHGLSTGAFVQITTAADPAANGQWQITVTSTTTFTIPALGTLVGGAAGQVVGMPTDANLDTSVASVWSDVAGVHMDTG